MYKEIDEGIKFYNISNDYKDRLYMCVNNLNNNKSHLASFNKIYNLLNNDNFQEIEKLWKIKNIDELFNYDIDPFVTNLMIVLSYKTHIKNMEKYFLDDDQINIHKKRVNECFYNDLLNRDYKSIRISQMLWAIYFIRVRLIEIGRLQYEYYNKSVIKIHIPNGNKLDINEVKKSIELSSNILTKIYNLKKFKYIGNSWLLSNQLNKIINKNTNIYKFFELFDVKDGSDSLKDILNFVYHRNECSNFNLLEENTSLQRLIKKELLNGNTFKLGEGILKYYEQ